MHAWVCVCTRSKKYTYNPRNPNNSAILNHINCNSMCIGKEENFKIIGSSHTDFTLCIKESLLIHKDKPKQYFC